MGDAGREVPLTAKLGGQAESAVKKKVQVRALAIAAGCRRGPGGGLVPRPAQIPQCPSHSAANTLQDCCGEGEEERECRHIIPLPDAYSATRMGFLAPPPLHAGRRGRRSLHTRM